MLQEENVRIVQRAPLLRRLFHLAWIVGVLVLASVFLTWRTPTEQYGEALRHGEALGLYIPQQPEAAPLFRLQDLSGQVVTLEDLRGKIVFLNFWATWCPPCRAEMPAMEKLFQQMQGKDFVMLAIDFQESPEQVEKFMEQFQFHFPVFLDTDGAVGTAYRVTGLPTTYILDHEGRIVASVVGARAWDSEASYAFFEHLTNASTIEARRLP